jgi:hypothetical protein
MAGSIPSADRIAAGVCRTQTFGRDGHDRTAARPHAGTEIAHAQGEGRVGRPGKVL